MAPLAGKPPFATDEPDSFYETPQAQPRPRQPKLADPNARTSAYDVYDNYLAGDSPKRAAPTTGAARNSGIGAMLLNMGDDSDDDSDDEETYRRAPAGPPGIQTPLSKNAALAAAAGAGTPPTQTRPSPPPQAQPAKSASPPQQQQMQQQQQQQQRMAQGPQNPATNQQQRGPPPSQPFQQQPPPQMQQPIAAPRPGYAAPMAALNLARPEPARQGPGMPMQKGPLAPIQVPNNNAFNGPAYPMPASPAPSAPHPLLPPMTPITAAFIRPSKSPVGGVVNVSFAGVGEEGKATPRKPIMRGNSEETLLPSRGEKGDDFWRRFSMVVKEETKKGGTKESSWLKQTLSGSARHSRWVWITGMFLILLIAGGVGVGVYFTRNSPSHQQPDAIGGSADNLATAVPVTTSTAASKALYTGSSSLHVSPTNTVANAVARRDAVVTPRAVPTQLVARHKHLKNRDTSAW